MAIARYLDEQNEKNEKRVAKLRRVANELARWRDEYQLRVANIPPPSTSNPCSEDFKATYKGFVAGIDRLLDIIDNG